MPGQSVHERWYVPSDGDWTRFAPVDGFPPLRLIRYGGEPIGELVLRLCEDATGLLVGPTDRRLPDVGIYVSNLRGERFRLDECRAGDFEPGQRVCLVREPKNPYDPFAVAVYDHSRRHMCGYVNKQKARMISRIIDNLEPLSAISLRGTSTGMPCEKVAILAAKPNILERLLEYRPSSMPMPLFMRSDPPLMNSGRD